MFRAFILRPVLRAIQHLEISTMAAIDTLTQEVSEATTVMQSAATLISGLKTKLDEAIAQLEQGDNGAALEALSTELDTGANALAAAVQANTPAENPPVEPPAEQPTEEQFIFTPAGNRMPR
jgi:hypothetical protein